MKIEYRKADITDAELLIDIYNFAFYSDYIKYGECPAYGKTKEMMVGAWLIGFEQLHYITSRENNMTAKGMVMIQNKVVNTFKRPEYAASLLYT